jgi:hypothetical protein
MMLMTKYLDRFANRRSQRRRPFISDWAAPPDNVRTIGQTCRGCGKAAQVELTTEDTDAVEYLCYEDLGPFLELFAHPGIREWTIVRLP